MRVRRVISCVAIVAIVAIVATVAVLAIFSNKSPDPPVVRLASVEPAGIMDDNGAEMWLVTVGISNSNPPLSAPGAVLFVRNNDRPTEAKLSESWNAVECPWVEGHLRAQITMCELSPGMERQRMLILPASSRSCRISLEYVGGVLSFKMRLAHLVNRMPLFVRSRVTYKFWRWAGYDRVYPGSNWREITVELPFSAGGVAQSEH
jgi:hypothetical protein